jgi:hypothetical protein
MLRTLFRSCFALVFAGVLALGPAVAQCGDPSGSTLCYSGQCYGGGYCADNTICQIENCKSGWACAAPGYLTVNFCISSLYYCSPVYSGCGSDCVYCG